VKQRRRRHWTGPTLLSDFQTYGDRKTGLRDWRRLLVPGGHVAMTEVCWMKPDPPPDCAAFWAQEYPAIRDASTLLAVIGECGYDTVDHFALPPSSWWDDYYRPSSRT
jgi:hypothetical protein